MQEHETTIAIPTSLYRRVEAAVQRRGGTSVEEFVAHAVRAALSGEEATSGQTPADEAQIVERLRRLGYID
jgi:metal-responsive CopG/Arc/MetJ family transcriptional regulator